MQLGQEVLKAGRVVISSGEFSGDINLGLQRVDPRLGLPHVYAIRTPSEALDLDTAFDRAEQPSLRDRDLPILGELFVGYKCPGERIPLWIATLSVLLVLLSKNLLQILHHAGMEDVLVDKDVPR